MALLLWFSKGQFIKDNFRLTHRKTVYLGKALSGGGPKRSIDIHKTPTKLWTQYRTHKEDSLEESTQNSNIILEENEENDDPQPSPRKINMERHETCERKYRSRSPLKNSPENLPTPPRKIREGQKEEDSEADTSKEASILDVNNDQLFDDSIFTVYSDNDLSRMHSKISKKWRKKWDKDDVKKRTFTTETIDRLVAKQESLVIMEEEREPSPQKHLVVDNEPADAGEGGQLQNLSTCSDWFNSTRDEMILYEKFGEDYDVIVNQMSHEEKAKLKDEVDKCVPKEASELLAMHQSKDSVDTEDLLPPSPAPIPKPRTMTPVKETTVQKTTSPMKLFPSLTPGADRRLFKTPQKTPNYLRPTTASKMRMSPRKHLSPHHHRAKEDGNDITPCPRSGFALSPNEIPKPRKKYYRYKKRSNHLIPLVNMRWYQMKFSFTTSNRAFNFFIVVFYNCIDFFSFVGSLKKTIPSHVDLNKIISPVGAYIRSNPAPPIMRQIRPKATKHFDDDLAAFEREEELLRTPESEKKKRMFKPLPMANYEASKVATLERVTSPNHQKLKALPKVFGITPSVEAKVKH